MDGEFDNIGLAMTLVSKYCSLVDAAYIHCLNRYIRINTTIPTLTTTFCLIPHLLNLHSTGEVLHDFFFQRPNHKKLTLHHGPLATIQHAFHFFQLTSIDHFYFSDLDSISTVLIPSEDPPRAFPSTYFPPETFLCHLPSPPSVPVEDPRNFFSNIILNLDSKKFILLIISIRSVTNNVATFLYCSPRDVILNSDSFHGLPSFLNLQTGINYEVWGLSPV